MSDTASNKLLLLGVFVIVFALIATACTRPRKDYQPDQPLNFSHYIHSGQHEIACQYCHTAPAMGRHSTVPSLDICMNCHKYVAVEKPAIIELTKKYNEGTPIEWTKVHDLPDFAYFNHQPHVAHFLKKDGNDKPGQLQGVCSNCHGEVNSVEKVATMNEFNMGWCVNCHRQNEAPLNCTTCHR
jgi:hypothetical protein